jgi:hypothetical protein
MLLAGDDVPGVLVIKLSVELKIEATTVADPRDRLWVSSDEHRGSHAPYPDSVEVHQKSG